MSRDKCCVYELRSPVGYAYVGITNNIKVRIRSHYSNVRNNIFRKHKNENDFDLNDFSIHVVKDNLTRDEAKQVEKQRIQMYEQKGKSLNVHNRTDLQQTFEVEMPNGEIKQI